MPEKRTVKKAQKAKREGKSPSTQAGAFVHEEINHIRKGKHGAKNAKEAIAIGLSKARKAGIKIPKAAGQKSRPSESSSDKIAVHKVDRSRARAATKRLEGESRQSVSHATLSRQAKVSATRRGATKRHASAVKAAHTRQRHKR